MLSADDNTLVHAVTRILELLVVRALYLQILFGTVTFFKFLNALIRRKNLENWFSFKVVVLHHKDNDNIIIIIQQAG